VDRLFNRRLTDFKTLKDAAAVADIRESGPKRKQILQVQLGAAAVIESGRQVDTVELLFMPRSGGTPDDWWLWSAPFDRALADEAADWLLAERLRAQRLDRPATAEDVEGLRDERFFFCAGYCEWFTMCRGRDAESSQEDLADAARQFIAGKQLEAAGKARKAEAAAALAGFSGRAGEWKVTTIPDQHPEVVDNDAIRFMLGGPLPMKESFRRGYVTVSRAK
jgi:hypothetical protein